MTLLSIITINYNDILGLERTIKSVQSQTIQDFEHIIIDGNSSDGSQELIIKTQENYSYWVSESDEGIYDGMNKGIVKAKGDYILFLNSGDDFSYDNALKDAMKYLHTFDFIYANIKVKDGNKGVIRKNPKELTFRYLFDNVPTHQSTFIRRGLFEKIGVYDSSLQIVADWKFFIIAICKYNATYNYVDKVFTNFYLGGISSRPENMKKVQAERKLVLEKEFPVFLEDIKYRFLLERTLRNLRKSKKIEWLIKLGLLNRF